MLAWKIYCGRKQPDGSNVTEREWRSFVDSCVRPRFEAFTIQKAEGYWRSMSEPSFVIEIVHPAESTEANVTEIAADYKRRFNQEAVFVMRNDVETLLV